MAAMPQGLARLPRTTVPLAPAALVGLEALRQIAQGLPGQTGASCPGAPAPVPALAPLEGLIDDLARLPRGVIMTMGKGGVGKTTLATLIAVELARRGRRVHLSTTDPAGHVDLSLDGKVPNLTVSRIDPVQETEAYRRDVMATAGAGLDAEGRNLLEEDLRSPCTTEIALSRAFAQRVEEGSDGVVVLDTAPTGHTLLLLDTTEAYHRQVSQTLSDLPDAVRQLLPRLRDPNYTRVLIVALPEATPVHEAAALQDDLRRAGIEPYGWIVNQCLTPLEVRHPVLRARKAGEGKYLEEIVRTHSARTAIVPWMTREGLQALDGTEQAADSGQRPEDAQAAIRDSQAAVGDPQAAVGDPQAAKQEEPMPTYDYICRTCGKTFEISMAMSEYDQKTPMACPHCHSKTTARMFNAVNVLGKPGGSGSRGGSGGCCCGGGNCG